MRERIYSPKSLITIKLAQKHMHFKKNYCMVIVLIRCKKYVFFQDISVKDIDTSLVVQKALEKKTCDSINFGRFNEPKSYSMTFHSDCLTGKIFSEQKNHRVSSREKNKNTETLFIGFSTCHYKKMISYISL